MCVVYLCLCVCVCECVYVCQEFDRGKVALVTGIG